MIFFFVFFFQAEDGIRDLVRSRGLGDVYKRQGHDLAGHLRQEREFDFSCVEFLNQGLFQFFSVGGDVSVGAVSYTHLTLPTRGLG